MKKVYKAYCTLEKYLVMAAFFTIMVLTFFNVFLRMANRPVIWADDICLLLFSWCAFMGADMAMRANRLVGMDILTSALPIRVQKVLQLVVYLFMIAVLSLFVVQGFGLAKLNWLRFMNSLRLSYGWATLSLPVGSCQMILTLIIKVYVLIKNFKNDDFTMKMHNPDGREAQLS